MQKEVKFIGATLTQAWTVELVADFSLWLSDRDGANPALPGIFGSHHTFFSALDSRLESLQAITEPQMLDIFKVSGLRRHLLPVTFLAEAGYVLVGADAKKEHVELERIQAILEGCGELGQRRDLTDFNDWLAQDGKPSRTRRLYMATAASLLAHSGAGGIGMLDEGMVKRYLDDVPGARANLGATLRFSCEAMKHVIRLPPALPRRNREPKPVVQLRSLLKKIQSPVDAAGIDVYQRAVAIAFQIPLSAISDQSWWPERVEDRLQVVSKNERVDCPAELRHVVEGWLRLLRSS